MKRISLGRNWWLRVGLFVALWTALALAEGASTYVAQMKFDKPVSWELALRRSFKDWYSLGLLAIGILWLCNRVRLEAGHFWRWFTTHLGASLVFAPVEVAFISWLEAGEVSVQNGSVLTFSYLFEKLGVHYGLFELIMYWMVVMGHLGWSNYQHR